MPPSLFDVAWDDLDADAVKRLLAQAGDEGLTWEAKGGGDRPRPDTARKSACGFANAIGGYLIVGAERNEQGRWTLPGVDFRGAEPVTWLSTTIAGEGGVKPVPAHDAKAFDRPNGRRAAVLAVDPVPGKPCMTAGGVVYVRVSGATVPVTDQQTLAAMIAEGEAVRHGAEDAALRAAQRLAEEPGTFSPQAVQIAVGLCPVGGPTDRNAVLFSQTFLDGFRQLVHRSLQADPRVAYGIADSMHQDGVRMWPAAQEWGSGWTAAAYWNGAVAAVFCDPSSEIYVEELLGRVRQGWTALAELAADYAHVAQGDRGDARVVVVFNREHAGVTSLPRGVPTQPARRPTTLVPGSEGDMASLERELRRGFGEPALEG